MIESFLFAYTAFILFLSIAVPLQCASRKVENSASLSSTKSAGNSVTQLKNSSEKRGSAEAMKADEKPVCDSNEMDKNDNRLEIDKSKDAKGTDGSSGAPNNEGFVTEKIMTQLNSMTFDFDVPKEGTREIAEKGKDAEALETKKQTEALNVNKESKGDESFRRVDNEKSSKAEEKPTEDGVQNEEMGSSKNTKEVGNASNDKKEDSLVKSKEGEEVSGRKSGEQGLRKKIVEKDGGDSVRTGREPESSVRKAMMKFAESPYITFEPKLIKWTMEGGQKSVKITNNTRSRQAIKIKCSDNAQYRVNPVFSFLDVGESIDIELLRTPGNPKNDKIVIVQAQAKPDETDPVPIFKRIGVIPLYFTLPLTMEATAISGEA
ncbi:hypothetical protein AB6A40_004558 [Gnathostoma spinigerum]|uniref:Major sperm protein n=1 Tax=Gnathostoma spinigerum TaxID=75299 RepID=A0ABD6ECU4_9BILA